MFSGLLCLSILSRDEVYSMQWFPAYICGQGNSSLFFTLWCDSFCDSFVILTTHLLSYVDCILHLNYYCAKCLHMISFGWLQLHWSLVGGGVTLPAPEVFLIFLTVKQWHPVYWGRVRMVQVDVWVGVIDWHWCGPIIPGLEYIQTLRQVHSKQTCSSSFASVGYLLMS